MIRKASRNQGHTSHLLCLQGQHLRSSRLASRLTAHSSTFNGATSLSGSSTFLHKHRKEQRTRRGHQTSIRAALPVVSGIPVLGPLANLVLNPVLLVALYAIGATRFWRGYPKTTYSDSGASKTTLTAMWPVLFIVSQAYRENFKKAVK
ncbi:hypothetical protein KFL_000140450 [Klebsormidium nitens]|uniref:Uncharacterized protein n=1 Tax=Klebsormidium nitens TaxID=105231 RepID=A0A1Y1HJ39_KLENI|nr:hypothetical protein KFL_000140450 [Klebsormidium nitens]|eukprot:GAQ78525.1 hypothetical protein KFL_000140450 [Klebsormidium nitens]